jgi:hypothetical protein
VTSFSAGFLSLSTGDPAAKPQGEKAVDLAAAPTAQPEAGRDPAAPLGSSQ